MSFELPFVTAVVLGSLHAFEADHLAAVTSFAVQKPTPRQSMGFGFRWAVGHGTSVLLAGTFLIFLGLRIPEGATSVMERSVGLVLIALGAWTVVATRAIHAHEHSHGNGTTHVHVHSHLRSHGHDHKHAPMFVGLLHGLAGAAPAVALVPLAMFDSAFSGLSYLLLFAAGTAASMTLYAVFASYIAGRATRFAQSLGRAVGQFTGVGTIIIGVVWLIR
ncbi:MAG TPA: sulfite exporter TauE/SafE family protein [Longimicrobiales bacterium]